MKNKTPLYLGGVFILLIALYVATSMNPREKSKGAVPLFGGEKPAIDKLEIVNNQNITIIVEEQDGIWNITSPINYRASKTAVDQSVATIQNIVIDAVISEKTESQEKFEVAESNGTLLKVYSGGEIILEAYIGKQSTNMNHTYARLIDSDEIVLWRGMVTSHVNRAVDDWRDKSIFTFNPEDIVSLWAESGNDTRTLTRADSLWIYTENKTELPVNSDSVRDLVGLVASLRCDSFADAKDIPRAATTKPDTKVMFKVRNGDVHSFDLWSPGENDAGRYLLRVEEGSEIFRFFRYRGELLAINYEKLKVQ